MAGNKMKNLLASLIVYLTLPVLLACAVQSCKAVSWKNVDKDTALAYLMYMECPEDSHLEAIKAQAILLRSNLCLYSSGEWSDLLQKSTTIAQEKKYRQVKDTYFSAIHETKGLVLKYKGQTMRGVYHEISSGKTREGKNTDSENYKQLTSVDSHWDMDAPGYLQVFTFSDNYLKRGFFRNQTDPQIKVILTNKGNYVELVQWGNTYVNGDFVRESLSLPSSAFTVSHQENQWIFTCKGVGHGLGMSLYGADQLAFEGKTYQEILKYYFPKYDILQE